MKKILILLIIFGLFVFSSCSSNVQENTNIETNNNQDNNPAEEISEKEEKIETSPPSIPDEDLNKVENDYSEIEFDFISIAGLYPETGIYIQYSDPRVSNKKGIIDSLKIIEKTSSNEICSIDKVEINLHGVTPIQLESCNIEENKIYKIIVKVSSTERTFEIMT